MRTLKASQKIILYGSSVASLEQELTAKQKDSKYRALCKLLTK